MICVEPVLLTKFVYSKFLHLVDFVNRYFVRMSPITSTLAYVQLIEWKERQAEDLLLQHINNMLDILLSSHLHLDSNFLQYLELPRCPDIRSAIRTRDESSRTACFPTLLPVHQSLQIWNK